MRDTLLLAFTGAVILLLLSALALAGGLPFYPYFLLMYTVAFAFVALMVYAGTQWVGMHPRLLYLVSTFVATGSMLVCLAQLLKDSFGKIIPLSFLLLLGTVLLPYLVANAAAYFWMSKRAG